MSNSIQPAIENFGMFAIANLHDFVLHMLRNSLNYCFYLGTFWPIAIGTAIASDFHYCSCLPHTYVLFIDAIIINEMDKIVSEIKAIFCIFGTTWIVDRSVRPLNFNTHSYTYQSANYWGIYLFFV